MTTLEAWEKLARFQPITATVMREHADRLARSIGAKVLFSYRHSAQAALRTVYGPTISGETDYAGRLHELGHLETQHAKAGGVTVRLGVRSIANSAGEAAAWTWARQHALAWTPVMEADKNECLASYEPFARHGLADPIWRELARVDGKLTLGHANWQLAQVGRLRLEDARQMLARVAR